MSGSSAVARKLLEMQPKPGYRVTYGVMDTASTVFIDGADTAVPAVQLASAGVLASGDYVALQVSSGDALIVGRVGTAPRNCAVSVTTTVGVANNTNTTVVYNTAMLNGTWRNGGNDGIVVPVAGVYMVTSTLNYAATVAGSRIRNSIRLNGTFQSTVDEVAIGTAGASSSVPITCAAGDVIDVIAFQNTGSTQSLDSKTRLVVQLLG